MIGWLVSGWLVGWLVAKPLCNTPNAYVRDRSAERIGRAATPVHELLLKLSPAVTVL